MKKNYLQPDIQFSNLGIFIPFCGSGVKGNNGIGYGGIDEEGELDPSVKALDEEEDYYNMLIEQEFVDKKSLW